jgi:hypothetical protein
MEIAATLSSCTCRYDTNLGPCVLMTFEIGILFKISLRCSRQATSAYHNPSPLTSSIDFIEVLNRKNL